MCFGCCCLRPIHEFLRAKHNANRMSKCRGKMVVIVFGFYLFSFTPKKRTAKNCETYVSAHFHGIAMKKWRLRSICCPYVIIGVFFLSFSLICCCSTFIRASPENIDTVIHSWRLKKRTQKPIVGLTVHNLQINELFPAQEEKTDWETESKRHHSNMNVEQRQQQLMQITSLDKMCLQMITLLCEFMPFSEPFSTSSSFSFSSRCSYLDVCMH